MWLTKLWWLFDFSFSFSLFLLPVFCLFFNLFGEVLFFAKLLDVYSQYVFDNPTLFACLNTSVDDELRCFFVGFFLIVVCNDRDIGVTLFLTRRAEFARATTEEKKSERVLGVFFRKKSTVPSWGFRRLLLESDGSETVHPPWFFLQRGSVRGFTFPTSRLYSHISVLSFRSPIFYVSGFRNLLLLVLHWVSIDISKQFFARVSTVSCRAPTGWHALLLAVNSWMEYLWK